MQGKIGEIWEGRNGLPGCNIKTPVGRARFVHKLWEPQASQEGGDPKYGAVILLAKENPTVQAWKAQLDSVLKAMAAKVFPGGFPPNGHLFIQDGDTSTDNQNQLRKLAYPEFANMWVVSGNNQNAPYVSDENNTPQPQKTPLIYCGCKALGAFTVKPYTKGTGGITAYLNGLQKVGDDEPLSSGGFDGSKEFAPVSPIAQAPVSTPDPNGLFG